MEWYFAQIYHGGTLSTSCAHFMAILQILLVFVAQGLGHSEALVPPERHNRMEK
jgi:hypothetical protein